MCYHRCDDGKNVIAIRKKNEQEPGMKVERNRRETMLGPSESFTGHVYVDPIAIDGSGMSSAVVHFTPGSRTAWHSHTHSQILYILEGVGRVQREGGPVEEVRAGDTVYFEPKENHWHGAAPDRFMAHVAMLRLPEDGSAASWGDQVSDAEYNGQVQR
jgi:quercetin dioxygenase-like cupin family protein